MDGDSGCGVKRVVYTIGHSSRTIREFISLLKEYGVSTVIDVRRWPRSRNNPQYSIESLAGSLEMEGISYYWIPELGGYRKAGRDVDESLVGSCYASKGFNAYEAYVRNVETARKALSIVERHARSETVALMCSERMPWRCHRKILSTILTERCFEVIHIIDPGQEVKHKPRKC